MCVRTRTRVRLREMFVSGLFVCLFAHVCLIYNMNKYGLCGVGCDCNCVTLILVVCSILCTYYVFFVFLQVACIGTVFILQHH